MVRLGDYILVGGEKERVRELLEELAETYSKKAWLETHAVDPQTSARSYVQEEARTYDKEGLRKLTERLEKLKEKNHVGLMDPSLVLAKTLLALLNFPF